MYLFIVKGFFTRSLNLTLLNKKFGNKITVIQTNTFWVEIRFHEHTPF